MNYQELASDFQAMLNRTDCTATQIGSYINFALRRAQQDLKMPSMERSFVVTPTTEPVTAIQIPTDLLQIKDLFIQFGAHLHALDKVDMRDIDRRHHILPYSNGQFVQALSGPLSIRHPEVYARYKNTLQIRPGCPVGAAVNLLYYGAATPFKLATDENEFSQDCPDVLLYGALSRAAGDFEHPNAQLWETQYQQMCQRVQNEIDAIENTGGPMIMENPYDMY